MKRCKTMKSTFVILAAFVGVGHADDLDVGQAAERPRVIGAYRTGAHYPDLYRGIRFHCSESICRKIHVTALAWWYRMSGDHQS